MDDYKQHFVNNILSSIFTVLYRFALNKNLQNHYLTINNIKMSVHDIVFSCEPVYITFNNDQIIQYAESRE